jgi:hypothetical protein
MNAFKLSLTVVSMASAVAISALSAQAQEPGRTNGAPEKASKAAPGHPKGVPGRGPQDARVGRGPQDAHMGRGPQEGHFARGPLPARDFGGHPYRGRMAWEGGRWRHEVHDGRPGWWWDVGGVWYYYPQPMEGPPNYVSEDYADDIGPGPDEAPVAYAPAPGPYAPPPPPPPPDPAASAVGGAIVGGVLGGLLTGRASGAAAGAVVGGATGAIAGATAAARPGYYFAQGNCYYRYPSGQYVQADPRACY